MKRQYIKPETEIVHTQGLLAGDEYTLTGSKGGTDADARSQDMEFMEEDTNGKGFGYRRYNLWED